MIGVTVVILCCLGLSAAIEQNSISRMNGVGAQSVVAKDNIGYHCAILTATNRNESPVHLGGGTIVSTRHVITVAHLVANKGWIRLAPTLYNSQFTELGSKAIDTNPSYVHVHEQYNSTSGDFDVAVIAYPGAQFYSIVASGLNPKLPSLVATTTKGSGLIVGFGFRGIGANAPSPTMTKTSQTVGACPTTTRGASATRFCASGEANLCPGDDGSAFVVGGVVMGIASIIPEVCAATGSTEYTDIGHESILNFITSLIGPNDVNIVVVANNSTTSATTVTTTPRPNVSTTLRPSIIA